MLVNHDLAAVPVVRQLNPHSGVQECMDLRLKWLFRPALSPAQMDEREASCPSELFTADPFKWDDADPKVQVRPSQRATPQQCP